MTILITGASGFIGQHVVRRALALGHRVVAVTRKGGLARLAPHANLQVLEVGMADVTAAMMANCAACIHLAAHGVVKGADEWEACFRVNVDESLRLWRAAAAAGVRRFVICGSCFEYGRSGERYDYIPVEAPLEPTGAYHASKAAASMAAVGLTVDLKLELVILRPFHVFGEGESAGRLWPSLRRAALAGEDFPMTAGEQVRDFVAVETVAEQFLNRATSGGLVAGKPTIENVGSGSPVSIRAFAEGWWTRWGARGKLKLGAVPYRPNEVMRYVPKLGQS